jgi:hypothetical protein
MNSSLASSKSPYTPALNNVILNFHSMIKQYPSPSPVPFRNHPATASVTDHSAVATAIQPSNKDLKATSHDLPLNSPSSMRSPHRVESHLEADIRADLVVRLPLTLGHTPDNFPRVWTGFPCPGRIVDSGHCSLLSSMIYSFAWLDGMRPTRRSFEPRYTAGICG